jgi:hypothetical protein
MNTHDITGIRHLSTNEIQDVSGALIFIAHPVVLKVAERGVIFAFGIDGLGNVVIDDTGIWGSIGSQGYSFPPAG